jgi:hypothetical protein
VNQLLSANYIQVCLAKITVVFGKTAGDLLTMVGLQEELGVGKCESVGNRQLRQLTVVCFEATW